MENLSVYQQEEEKKDKRYAAIVTTVVHIILLIMFYFIKVWTPPDPPLPVAGIEVNFGTSAAGYGDIQSRAKPSRSTAIETPRPSAVPSSSTNSPSATPSVSNQAPKMPEPEPIKTFDAPTEDPIAASKPKPEPKREEPKAEPQKSSETSSPSVNPRSVITPNPSPNNTTEPGSGNRPQGNNNGNVPGAVGDQGSLTGKIDARSLVGGGGGSGTSLNLEGWRWNNPPDKRDPSGETGFVTIKFKINQSGEVLVATIADRSVSLSVAEFYRKQVLEMTFSPISDSEEDLPTSTVGSITFYLTRK
ncbi:MAG: hypothetical protein NZM38_03910 [Cytophagales bacterium]|nr:hypothetical protein [Cytophagales bacterium]MDW8383897.1 hypothetical protein [Flammeovirgaceae bacterium]